MKEIERKFLVNNEELEFIKTHRGIRIEQAYIQNEKDRTVRLRTKGDKAFLTIKSGTTTLSRDEFEYQIPVEDALAMMDAMELKTLTKTRYEIELNQHKWEVDVFEGKLEGLIIAEIELKTEDEYFQKPTWLREEVTFDSNYLNANLINQL
jgi:CYTH domain-containing protein